MAGRPEPMNVADVAHRQRVLSEVLNSQQPKSVEVPHVLKFFLGRIEKDLDDADAHRGAGDCTPEEWRAFHEAVTRKMEDVY